ncbi:transmembrane protein 184-like protein [Cucumis melo var. makuwa]|uniref:Transmembrane protein 184-like protein n=1 Tax=Cucumis melo var. makuwa TaxID=1194695 RepID=A0A5D3BBJ6_CUCMM|nr:transmembrane protein 184-like protein [Cucumis melo var. makuwa]
MTRDMTKLQNITEYKESRVFVTTNNSKLPIAPVGKTMIVPYSSSNQAELVNVFYVLGMKKTLVSISQLTSAGNFVIFGPDDIKVYHNLKGIVLEMLAAVGIIKAEHAWFDVEHINEALQNAFVCVEMVFFAMIQMYAYSANPYKSKSEAKSKLEKKEQ